MSLAGMSEGVIRVRTHRTTGNASLKLAYEVGGRGDEVRELLWLLQQFRSHKTSFTFPVLTTRFSSEMANQLRTHSLRGRFLPSPGPG